MAELLQVYFVPIDTSARLVQFNYSNGLPSTSILGVEASEQVIVQPFGAKDYHHVDCQRSE